MKKTYSYLSPRDCSICGEPIISILDPDGYNAYAITGPGTRCCTYCWSWVVQPKLEKQLK